ncbi:tail fiber domain-containing protein [Azospirillum palustre]
MVSSPSMPDPPDPVATAQAQGAINRDTAISNATMSHVNQTSPYGSQTWSYDLSTPGGRAWSDYANAYANWSTNRPAPGASTPAASGGAAPSGGASTGEAVSAPANPDSLFFQNGPSSGAASQAPAAASYGPAPTAPTLDPQWRLDTRLTDAQQQMLDTTNRIGNSALNIGESQLGRVGSSLSSPLSSDGLPARQMTLGATGQAQTSLGATGQAQTSIGPDWNNLSNADIERYFGGQSDIQAARAADPNFNLAQWYQTSGKNEVMTGQRQADGNPDPTQGIQRAIGNTAGSIQYNPGYGGVQGLMGQAGNIQRSLDLSGLTALPGTSDFSADRQRVEDALYGRTTSRLDPQWQQQQNDLAVRLANQGVTTGSEAWQREMDAFNRGKNDAYSTARNDAILAGGTEQSRLFGNALAARQQGYNEVLGSGNFANSAQNQAFSELTTDRNRYTNEMDRLLSANNGAQAQDFGQQASRAAFTNAAQAQGYGQALSNAQFANAGQQQNFAQTLAGAQFANAGQQQNYSQALGSAQFANNARDAAMNERSTLRMAPLNELRGLMGMGAVQSPQFGQVQTPQQAAPDLMGATYNSYNGQMNAANAANANNTSMFNGVLGAAASVAPYAIMMSDRRVKRDIERIGTAGNGLPLYRFQYIWGGPVQIGVMAQDVEEINPAAVVDVGGIKAVDYGRAFAGA